MRKTRTFVTKDATLSLYMVLAGQQGSTGVNTETVGRTNELYQGRLRSTAPTRTNEPSPRPAAPTRTNVHLSDIRQSNTRAGAGGKQRSTGVKRGSSASSAAIVKNFTILVDRTCGSSARAARDFPNI